MKIEITDVSDTKKTVIIEIPSDAVDAEFDRVARGYSRQASIPGFRKGKVPPSVIRQRFRDQILHDVSHALIPRAMQEALESRGIEPVDTPNIEKVSLAEGQPLTFTAAVETLPPIDPGDLSTLSLQRTRETVTDEAVAQALEQLRERAARFEPVEGRPVADGDTVVLDLDRTGADGETEHHEHASVQLGSPGNPPGFDANLVGMTPGESRTFTVEFPADFAVPEMAGATMTYTAAVKEVRRRVVPELDDEFARDLGEFDSLDALKTRVRADLEAQASAASERRLRDALLTQLSERVTFEPPDSLVEHEIDRRLRELVEQMMAQNIDPRQAGVDWGQFREGQRETARMAVRSALVLDAIAHREDVQVPDEDIEAEIARFAEQARRTPDAIRAQLEKEGRIPSLRAGLRREKAVELALARATVQDAQA